MAVTSYVILSATSPDALQELVQAAIDDDDLDVSGGVLFINGLFYQVMVAGAPLGTIDDIAVLDTRLDTAESDIDALETADTALDARLDIVEAEAAQTTYNADGAIAATRGTAVLIKTSAAAMTLAAPAAAGVRKRIMVGTSFAHVVTATGLLDDGATEGGNTITFDAKKGASVILESYGGHWLVVGGNHYTVA